LENKGLGSWVKDFISKIRKYWLKAKLVFFTVVDKCSEGYGRSAAEFKIKRLVGAGAEGQ
jgi:hypothetical protein